MISTKQKAFIPEPSRIWEATGALFNQQYSYLHIREINIETNDDDTHVEIVNTSVVTTDGDARRSHPNSFPIFHSHFKLNFLVRKQITDFVLDLCTNFMVPLKVKYLIPTSLSESSLPNPTKYVKILPIRVE